MRFEPGDHVTITLREPREKLLGILSEISHAGVSVRAIDLSYFDDWVQSIIADEPHLPMNDYFLPMWRVERMSRDESSDQIDSMSDQFEKRTGRRLADY